MAENLTDRTLRFSIEVVKLVRRVKRDYSLTIIFSQLLRAATSIEANFEEAQNASSRDDFIYKVSVSIREARETRYWLMVIVGSGLIQANEFGSLIDECEQLIKILTTIVKRSKERRPSIKK